MRSTDVMMKLNAVAGRYIKRDLGSPLILREADGTEVMIVAQAIVDGLVDDKYLRLGKDGKYRLTSSGTEQAQHAAGRQKKG